MKKALFLAVFGVFCLVLVESAEAGYRGSFCTPSPNRQFGQLNWRHESGGLFTGHLDSMRGPWIPPPECYRPPQHNSYYPPYPQQHYPRYDGRYDRRGGGNDALTNALASFLGAFAGSAVGNQAYQQQPAPVYTPPQPVYAPPPPPVYSAPVPTSLPDRRCTNFRVTGDNHEAVWAVERALRSRGYGVSSSTNCEVAVRYEEVGDPQSRIFLRVTDANGNVRHSDGAQFYKRGDTLARADAIVIAARVAVSGI